MPDKQTPRWRTRLNRLLWWRSRAGRWLHNVEHGQVGPLIPRCQREQFSLFLQRAAATPSCERVVLRFVIDTANGPWALWCVYKIVEVDRERTGLQLEAIAIPGSEVEDALRVPPDHEQEAIFEVAG